jgi:valyl-tRNA synthetase
LGGVTLRAVDRLAVGGDCVAVELGGTTFQFPAAAVGRFESWRAKERQRLTQYLQSMRTKLDNQSFVANAPASVVAGEQQKIALAIEQLRALE